MKNIIKFIYRILLNYGIDCKKFYQSIFKSPFWIYNDYKSFLVQKGSDDKFSIKLNFPIWTDKSDEGGTMKGHYFHQDLYVARLIYIANPQKHLDVGSRTDGFVAHIATFREIELFDIRDVKSNVRNINFRQINLMKIDNTLFDYCDSLSSLHAIEHFGLGRYGDPIDYFGYLKAIQNIYKILKIGGTFYFSVPIGPQRIEFNAHRVFSLKYLIEFLSEYFEISIISIVDDKGDFHENILITEENIFSNYGCTYGTGIFVLKKINSCPLKSFQTQLR